MRIKLISHFWNRQASEKCYIFRRKEKIPVGISDESRKSTSPENQFLDVYRANKTQIIYYPYFF